MDPFSSESTVILPGHLENMKICMFRKNKRKGCLFFLTVHFHCSCLKAISSEKIWAVYICECNGRYFLLIKCSAILAVVISQCKDNSVIRCKNLRNIRKHQTKIMTNNCLFSDDFFDLNWSLCIPALPARQLAIISSGQMMGRMVQNLKQQNCTVEVWFPLGN